MKTGFLFFCFLLITINCSSLDFENECENVIKPNDIKDCTSVNSDSEPNNYCCLVEYEFKNKPDSGEQEGKLCDAITKDEYENLSGYTNSKEEFYKNNNQELNKFKINCESIFLKIGLVSIIISLLF